MKIKILKKGIRHEGKYTPCFYRMGGFAPGMNQETITVYAKSLLDKLPLELKPENGTDITTDYCETDFSRIEPSHPLYNEFRKHI